jgi:hypothetical protein
MAYQLFARAKPKNIRIIETYLYHASISGNPTLEESGKPQGVITVELPFDGEQYFTRWALADVQRQHKDGMGGQSAVFGHLAVSGISPEALQLEDREVSNRRVLELGIPVPDSTEQLKVLRQDQYRGVFEHSYTPKWPEVYPRSRPISLDINIYDEHTLQDLFESGPDVKDWSKITQELSFERSLYFSFHLELALPPQMHLSRAPILRLMRLEWPVATSYHMLQLNIEPADNSRGEWPEHNLVYVPDKGSVEWQNVDFQEGPLKSTPATSTTSGSGAPHFYHAPIMILMVREPGELYQKPNLTCHMQVDLDGGLLSNLDVDYFDATGRTVTTIPIETHTELLTDIIINLKQRFDRKTLSPYLHLEFEGVMPEEERMRDISTFLKDLGFRVEDYESIVKEANQRAYIITGKKTEGSDEMTIWIIASGNFGVTERETVIPGGKTFKTTVRSGNMTLDMRAEMSGNVRRLTHVLNTIHTTLKERFPYSSTLE